MPVDGYLGKNLIVFRGLQKGGYVSRGIRVVVPDFSNVEVAWLNNLEDDMRVLLASLRDHMRLQVHWYVDSDYRKELLNYREQTEKRSKNQWTTYHRNWRFTNAWERMERRELRREKLFFYLSTPVDIGGSPIGKGKKAAYQHMLDAANKELSQYEPLYEYVFNTLGGEAKPLDDMGHFRELYRFFNPSSEDDPNLDYEKLFDPEHSILDNCFNNEGSPLSRPDYGFYMDGYYHGILVLRQLPKGTVMGMISQLTNLPMLDYSITVNVTPRSVEKEIQKEERAYEKLSDAYQNNPKLRMLFAMENKKAKIGRLMSNQVIPYNAQFIIRAWDKTKEGLRAKQAALRTAIGKLNGAKFYDPAFPTSARNYFYASVPGWCWDKYDDYTHYIDDVNLSNLLPISATPVGNLAEAEILLDGENGNLIGIQTFDGTPGNEGPAHLLMTGSSGNGKSVLTMEMMTQSECYFDYTVIVEEGLSYGIYTQTVSPNARPIIIQPNGNLTINYFDTRGLPLNAMQLSNGTALLQLLCGQRSDEDKNRMREALLASALKELYDEFFTQWSKKNREKVFEITRHAMTLDYWLEQKMPIGSTLLESFTDFRDFQKQHGDEADALLKKWEEDKVLRYYKDPNTSERVRNLSFAYFKPEEFPHHSHLQEKLLLDSHGTSKEADELGLISKLLEPWCRGGNYGALVDGVTNIDITDKIAHFELGYIPESAALLKGVAGFLITNDARNEVMRRPRSQRKRFILEELSAFLSISSGPKIVLELYERMRKYNCWVCSIIQQSRRFRESPVRPAVMGNSRMGLLLKQSDTQELDAMCERFALPEVTKRAVMRFPDPGKMKNTKPYSGVVYYHEQGDRPLICVARNYANREMIYCSSSTGSIFEKRAKELKGHNSVIEGIFENASKEN